MGSVRWALAIIIFTATAAVDDTAEARLPEVQEVLERSAACERPTAPHEAVFWGRSRPKGPVIEAIRLIQFEPGDLRVSRQALSSTLTHEVTHIHYAAREPVGDKTSLEKAPLWLQYWSGASVEALLRQAGVDMNRTAFDHLDGVVLWVVGGGPMDRDVPTFSFERDTGCLRRIQLPNGPSGPETTLLNVATVVEQLRLLEANGDSPKAVKASLRSSVPALSIQRSNNVLSYRLNTLTKLGVVEH